MGAFFSSSSSPLLAEVVDPLNHIRDRGDLTRRPHLLALHFLGDLMQVVVQEARSAHFVFERGLVGKAEAHTEGRSR